MAWGGADRSDAITLGGAGSDVLDDGQQLGEVFFEVAACLAERDREPAYLGLPDGLVTAGGPGRSLRQDLKSGIGQRATGGLPVCVIAG